MDLLTQQGTHLQAVVDHVWSVIYTLIGKHLTHTCFWHIQSSRVTMLPAYGCPTAGQPQQSPRLHYKNMHIYRKFADKIRSVVNIPMFIGLS